MSDTLARSRISRFAAVVLLSTAALVSLPASGVTQEGSPPPTYRDLGSGTDLPVTGVTLFTSGVGYFQHDGEVSGDARVDLTFSTGDVNDLLKSLVLQDFDGGTVEAVTYPSQDPLSRILGSFSLDVADNPTFAELVNRARGAEVVVDGPVDVTGTVSGVEYRTVQTDSGSESRAILTLLTGQGLRQLAFADIGTLRFTDAALQAELKAALEAIATNRREDRKTITIRFTGEGRRRVRVGYVRAVPVWKTSYRVVLNDDGTAQLQGWAIVENTGEVDWSDVRLGLVSGHPISFVMDLYSPIYTQRPRVAPEAGVSVAPQQYDRAVAREPSREPSLSAPSAMRAEESLADDMGFQSAAPTPERMDLSQGVQAAAVAERGAVYRISHPVSIPRRGAALIPIVAATVPAERVSIYDRSVLANAPLQAVRLANETSLQLPAGPATIFRDAGYAGDARVPAMIAGEDRLVSFAVDSGSNVLVRTDAEPQTITRIRVVNGMLEVTSRETRTTEYVVERLADDGGTHLVVHPRTSGWELMGALEPTSETRSTYRFTVEVAGGTTTLLAVDEERVRAQRVSFSSMGDDQIAFYLSHRESSAETERVLERLRELRSAVARTERARREVEESISTIHREQERIRSNLDVLDRDSELYQRYLETMSSQEQELEQLQAELRTARGRENAARSDLRAYIESL